LIEITEIILEDSITSNIDSEIKMGEAIPGYSEVCEWPTPVKYPMKIIEIGSFRCNGVRPSVFVILKDANKTEFPFFFDNFLGRLCFGALHNTEEGAAYIKSNSQLEQEAFEAITSAMNRYETRYPYYLDRLLLLRECLEHAKVYAGSQKIVPNLKVEKPQRD
jgi:hypothetical protein